MNGIQKAVGSNPICSMRRNPSKIPDLVIGAGFLKDFLCMKLKKCIHLIKNIWTFSDFWCMIKEIMMIMKEELTGWQDWGFGS